MAKNIKSPGTGMPRDLEYVFVGTIDILQIAPKPLEIQTVRLCSKCAWSQAAAAVAAGLAYETWRRA